MWASLCLIWTAIFFAEYRRTKMPSRLLMVAAALAQTVAFTMLSISTGALVLIPFPALAGYVRALALASSISGWFYTAIYLIDRFYDSRADSTPRHFNH